MNDRAKKVSTTLIWVLTVLGCILSTQPLWRDALDPLIYDSHGEYRSDGIFRWLSQFLLLTQHFAWLIGLPLLFIGFAGLVFVYGRNAIRFTPIVPRPFTTVALAVALFAHTLIFAMSVQFFFVSAGSHIRPMGWALFAGIVSFMSLVLVEPISVVAIIKEKPRLLGVGGLIFGVTPLLFASLLLRFAAWVKGFQLSP